MKFKDMKVHMNPTLSETIIFHCSEEDFHSLSKCAKRSKINNSQYCRRVLKTCIESGMGIKSIEYAIKKLKANYVKEFTG